MQRIKTDICVIGAGSGGLSVAAGAVQMGAQVVLIEGHKMGGDCLNYGCVPSKALLSAAAKGLDWTAAHAHVRDSIDRIAPNDSQTRFEGLGCTVIRDYARFTSKTEVVAGDTTITARRFVIATGSRASVPSIPGLVDVPYLTNESIFQLEAQPAHLIILGGGPIGIEMAQAHRDLGCAVTVVTAGHALPKEDPEAAALVIDALRAKGVRIVEGVKVNSVSGNVTLHTDAGDFSGTHLLVATGRVAALDRLDLGTGGVDYDTKSVKVGDNLRSVSNRRVYAIGDAAGGPQFTHLAGYHAGVIVRSMLLGLPSKARADHIPRVTYTTPELAQIGLTESEARGIHCSKLEVYRADFDHNDRAVATGMTTGFAKVMVVKGRLVGATIVGPNAGDLIGIWALAMANGLKMSAISSAVLPYPTLGEINKRLAGSYFSPRLFENGLVKKVVGAIQRLIP